MGDFETKVVHARVNKQIYAWLEKMTESEGMTITEYLRNYLQREYIKAMSREEETKKIDTLSS